MQNGTETAGAIPLCMRGFELAAWAYLAIIHAGLGYAVWRGASFFQALRQAQFQFAALQGQADQAADTSFLPSVVASWPQRLAAFPSTGTDAADLVLIYILFTACRFAVYLRRPAGVALPANSTRVIQAKHLAGFTGQLCVRTDASPFAASLGNIVFLPTVMAQKLDRRSCTNAAEQIAFVIRHERAHSTTSDNLLWLIGTSLSKLLAGIACTLLATPILYATAASFPARLDSVLPATATYIVYMCVAFTCAVVIGAAISGFVPNLLAAREYFADQAAVRSLGLSALPYDDSENPQRVATNLTVWGTNITPPDRRLHALGQAPRAGALAAGGIALWIAVRSLIMLLDQVHNYAVTIGFDLACLPVLATMLCLLPPRDRTCRSYGSLLWTANMVMAAALPLSFWAIGRFVQQHVQISIIPAWWLWLLAAPPLAVLLLVPLWLVTRRHPSAARAPVDQAPPRRAPRAPMILFCAAMPAIWSSYALAGLVLFTSAGSITDWCTQGTGPAGFFLGGVAIVAIMLAFLCLMAKNIEAITKRTAAAEAGITILAFTVTAYIGAIIAAMAAAQSPGMSGPPLDFNQLLRAIANLPRGAILPALAAFAMFSLVLIPSWCARYRFARIAASL